MMEDFLLYIILSGLTLLIIFLFFQVFSLGRRLNTFFKKGEIKDLEAFLTDLSRKSQIQEKDIKKILERISKLEEVSKISFQKVGLVRYNPFKEVGGDQSFSLALLDKQNSGLVITSLYLREGNRVYAKPVTEKRSEYPLSEEEKRAMEKAVSSP